jgi:hypothetical protein
MSGFQISDLKFEISDLKLPNGYPSFNGSGSEIVEASQR